MKYIDADRLIAEIERRRDGALERQKNLEKIGQETVLNEMIAFELNRLISFIASLQQEQPKLTQVPRIEQEAQKKGWMDYGLLISEIGLHRSNAIDRIKETKERATEIKRNIAPQDLAILGEYLESAGAEIVLCCLQQYCMDFMFTQDEVKEIIQQKQSEFNIPSAGSGAMGTTPPKFKLEVKEQPVEGLEGAAENIYKTPFGTRAEDFKAGAEWQKEQDTREMIMSDGSYFQKCYELGKKDMKKEMLEDAIEGRVGQTGFHNSIYIKEPKWCDTLNNFNNGDKVRVIIIKDDK